MTTIKPQDVWWRRLLRNEPVMVAAAVPVLTTIGVMTATQANAVATAVSAVLQVVAAFAARSQVSPVKKAQA